MPELTIIQRFNMARTAFDESVQQVADRIVTENGVGISRNYLYECLKYPNKNLEIFRQACDYINSAGITLPDDRKAKRAKKVAQ